MKEMASKQLIEKLIGLVKLVEKQNERVMLAVVDRTQKEFAKCKSHAERDKVLTEFIQTIQGFGIAGGHKVKIVVNENGSWKLLLV
jgi:transcriptional regulator CtsR